VAEIDEKNALALAIVPIGKFRGNEIFVTLVEVDQMKGMPFIPCLLWQMMLLKLLPLKMESQAGNWPLSRHQARTKLLLLQPRNWWVTEALSLQI
jgi:hypothetical protein